MNTTTDKEHLKSQLTTLDAFLEALHESVDRNDSRDGISRQLICGWRQAIEDILNSIPQDDKI